jgi:mannose-1-phosphate guanylyltransferase/mannose-1-phosphate guanylyltransferase/mannose-6-phosphate isomerase
MSTEAPKPFQEKRPWGEEIWISRNGFSSAPLALVTPDTSSLPQSPAPSMVKIITVYPGELLSLQYHHHRDEYWRIISGNGVAEIGEEKIALNAGTDCFIPRETKHRLHGGTENLVLLELAFGDFDEGDIVRLEDKYGRK